MVVHTYIWGPTPITCNNGYQWYVSFIDEISRHSWIYILKDKGVIVNAFLLFKSETEFQVNKRIKILQCDRGGEYGTLTPILASFGIIKQVLSSHLSVKRFS